ncbi:MAG TPA: hypothetical protein VMV54_08905 [Acidocella sp.]|nr:hypothetical protein [Acidocella sp.]
MARAIKLPQSPGGRQAASGTGAITQVRLSATASEQDRATAALVEPAGGWRMEEGASPPGLRAGRA